jgi:hypothetical protein
MRCLACETEKQAGSWLCPNCGTPIPEPRKPPYQAAGWEWAASLACFFLLVLFPAAEPADTLPGVFLLVLLVAGPAFAFAAARDRRSAPMVVGCLCLTFWILLLVEGRWPLLLLAGYMVFILTLERVVWRVRLARM